MPIQFDRIVVAQDRIVFSAPGLHGNRLICVDAKSGRKFWELGAGTNFNNLEFLLRNKILVTPRGYSGENKILECDPGSGELKPLYTTGHGNWGLIENDERSIFAQSDTLGLRCVDSFSWKDIWKAPSVSSILGRGDGVLLCDTATIHQADETSFMREDCALAGVSQNDGHVLWRLPHESSSFAWFGITLGTNFVVALGDSVYWVAQTSGHVIGQFKLSRPASPWKLEERDGWGFLWTFDELFSLQYVYVLGKSAHVERRLSLPSTYWEAIHSFRFQAVTVSCAMHGTWNARDTTSGKRVWSNIQAGRLDRSGAKNVYSGYHYFSQIEGKYRSLKRLHVASGKQKELYREELPEEIQIQFKLQ